MAFLSFSRSIPLFLAIQTVIFFLLLRASERAKVKDGETLRTSNKTSSIAVRVLCVLLIIGVVATILFKFRYTLPYTVITMLAPAILVPLIATGSSSKLMLVAIILWHFMLIAPEMPSDQLAITEGVHMTRTIILHERWLPEMAHNPSYNPFPTMAFIRAALSLLTGLPWFDWSLGYILIAAVALAFDLTLFALTFRMLSDRGAGLLAVMIAALTPYLLVTSHAYQVPANVMWLLCTSTLIKPPGKLKRSDAIVRAILFSSATLTHPTAYIAMIFPLTFLSLTYIVDKRLLSRYSYVRGALFPILVIGLFRFVYEEAYARYVGKMPFDAVEDLAIRIFAGGEFEAKLSLYDCSGIPFYQAFLWSLTASLACALILHYVLKRSVDITLFSLFITASIFIAMGYVMATLTRVSTQLYRGQYVAFSLLVPLAALTTKKILDSRSKGLIAIMALLFISSSLLVMNDPEISPRIVQRARGVPEIVESMRPTLADLVKAESIIGLTKGDINTISRLMFYSEASIAYERITSYGECIPMVYGRLQDALYKALYVHGHTIRDRPIVSIDSVVPSELSDAVLKYSMVHNFGREYVFLKS